MALLILALLQRIFLMSSLMLLLVWLIFFMVLIKLLPILGTISGKSVDRKSGSAGMPRPISYAVFCLKKKTHTNKILIHLFQDYVNIYTNYFNAPCMTDRINANANALNQGYARCA